jgi:hypothetical protein
LSRLCIAGVPDFGLWSFTLRQLNLPDLFVWVVAYLVGTEATGIFIGLAQERLMYERNNYINGKLTRSKN